MAALFYLDTMLVPMSLFLMVAYHGYLWHHFKAKPSQITHGIYALSRKSWFLKTKEGDHKNGVLVVQSLRNTQMATIFSASIAILINVALASLTNNVYNASNLLNNPFFGSQSSTITIFKFGSASLFLLISFLCNSIALGFLIDANFLINLNGCDELSSSPPMHAQTVMERGFLMGLIGNRVLCISFPLLAWLLGPLPVALSSAALVWALYELDFNLVHN